MCTHAEAKRKEIADKRKFVDSKQGHRNMNTLNILRLEHCSTTTPLGRLKCFFDDVILGKPV